MFEKSEAIFTPKSLAGEHNILFFLVCWTSISQPESSELFDNNIIRPVMIIVIFILTIHIFQNVNQYLRFNGARGKFTLIALPVLSDADILNAVLIIRLFF